MKKILVLYFTQSGQQKAILESFLEPFKNAGSGYEIQFEDTYALETSFTVHCHDGVNCRRANRQRTNKKALTAVCRGFRGKNGKH